jgi:hypothetical protein
MGRQRSAAARLLVAVASVWAISASGEPPPSSKPKAVPTTKLDALMPKLKALAADPAVVEAVRAQNDKKLTLTAIQKLDTQWRESAGVPDFVRAHLENPCASALKKHTQPIRAVAEAFAMDNQGALVGTTRKTSDYWQGDEDKWKKSFAGGKGAPFIDKPEFDESAQVYMVQISLPVMHGGKAIGAITLGLNLDLL